MVKEFVEGWDITQTLGEGAFGEVLMIVKRTTQECVAVKTMNLLKISNAADIIKKEIFIHRMLDHESIIKCYGCRKEGNLQYIFLQYASGGELFDRIEPDHGMPQNKAQKYFRQIISGVEYLHSMGVAHRDLKPENLLLDADDNIKISDFGMATIFRHAGKERSLSTRCGTLPYVAPEVFVRDYKAEPADVWSCGIILVALLAGELPWDKPQCECKEYLNWKDSKFSISPWTKIDNLALALLRKILMHSASKRYTIPQIKSHLWLTKSFKSKGCTSSRRDSASYKRLCSNLEDTLLVFKDGDVVKARSQPEPSFTDEGDSIQSTLPIALVSFSQPAQPENMLLSSQITTSGTSLSPLQRLVKRMTRFFTKVSAGASYEELTCTFEKLGYRWKKSAPGQLTVHTLDRRKMNLVFKASLIEMQDNILLDFRLSKGDGLEFKHHFLKIRDCMCEVIVKGPIIWPLAAATNSVP